MKYLSFSLWGDKPIYNIGAIKNAELWKKIYTDWQMVVYYDKTVPIETIDKLKELDVLTIDVTKKNLYGMFWRFLAVDLPESEYCVFRDTDSRITIREKMAVDEWIDSNLSIHVMRDHPAHGIPYGNDRLGILGGMWGIKSKVIPLVEMIENFTTGKNLSYGSDQTFLGSIYSRFENDRKTHDNFYEKKPFPISRVNGRFIGERINVNEQPLTNDHLILL